MPTRDQRIAGVLFGTAVAGDDNETRLVAAALARSQGDPALFERTCARSPKRWLLALRGRLEPVRGAALLGVYASYDLSLVRELVRSTCLSHGDPGAEQGALAVAVAAALATKHPGLDSRILLDRIIEQLDDQRLIELLLELDVERSSETIANARGLEPGASDLVHHTVPRALRCWLRNRESFERALTEASQLGSDTATVAAIVGALSGAELGVAAIPKPWLEGLAEWPATPRYLEHLAHSLARAEAPPRLFWPAVALRNLVFFGLVLVQGVRRALPPY